MQHKCIKKKSWLIIVLLVVFCHASAQDSSKHNTEYYETYPDLVTARTYFSQKFTNLILKGKHREEDLKYRPNTTLNYGIGGTYGWFTLNLAYGFHFLNRGNSSKGNTRYLDLQSHVYTRKMSIDLFGQFYKGFYLDPQGTATEKDKYYKRPDIKVRHMGAAVYYIVDWDKLSMRAAMLQTEWQKKSAGSLLLGGEVYYGYSKGDSALLPGVLGDFYTQDGVTKIRYFDIGPGIGYAYTYVHKEHFFAMGGITGSLPINFMKEVRNDKSSDRKVTISPDLMMRIGIGYSNESFNISATFVNNMFTTKGNSGKYMVNTGNIRLNAAWRFDPGVKAKRTLKFFRSKV